MMNQDYTFPTRTLQHQNHKPYYLRLNLPARHNHTLDHLQPHTNIFKNAEIIPEVEYDELHSRPVGGIQLIKKLQQKEKGFGKKGIKRKASIDEINRNRLRRTKTEMRNHYQAANRKYNTLQSIDPHEEIFKEDRILSKIKKTNHSQIKLNNAQSKDSTSLQRKSYIDKNAVLDEIDSSRPLIEQVGDKYFQFILRDRWKEQVRPPHFIYQLRKGEQFTRNKAVTRLKELKPQIKQRRQLLLKGKHLLKI